MEVFLATLIFLRPMLSPMMSEVSKPLRDVQSTLQLDRQAGLIKKRYKEKGTKPIADEMGRWAPWWTEQCENSFEQLKEMAASAIRLTVPDFAGATSGTNPFLVHADGCRYSLGGAILQRASIHRLDGSHYAVLGASPDSTKVQLQMAYTRAKHRIKELTTAAQKPAEHVYVLQDTGCGAQTHEQHDQPHAVLKRVLFCLKRSLV